MHQKKYYDGTFISIQRKTIALSLSFGSEDMIYFEAMSRLRGICSHRITCSISYAWEPEGMDPVRKQAQFEWIERFARHLTDAGFEVTLDRWDNLHTGDIAEFVKKVASRDKVFLIGTPLLKVKADKSFSVIHQEVNALIQRRQKDPSFLFLVVREGEHNLSFPDAFTGNASTDMRRDAEYPQQLLDMVAKAIGIDRQHAHYSAFEAIKKEMTERLATITPPSPRLNNNSIVPLAVSMLHTQYNSSAYIRIPEGEVPVTISLKTPRYVSEHYDFSIEFDITNMANTDLRVARIRIKLIKWTPLEEFSKYIPYAGLGKVRKFFCLINDTAPGYYAANFEEKAGRYLKLAPGELEAITLAVNTLQPGKYTVEVIVDCSVGGKAYEVVAGRVAEMRFLSLEQGLEKRK